MACVVACQDQNDPDAKEATAFRHVAKLESGAYPSARIDYFSLSCQQCGDAPCLAACPTNAIFRRTGDGVVAVDRDLCVGCHTCELTCPFGAPKFRADGRMAKCDLCHTRLEHGLRPACVLACPSAALDVGPIDELSGRKAHNASVKILQSLVAVTVAKV
jgi:anaerobic dimethyl sulfoxide reductase subunit B (iron-sulfur subunit)